MKKGDFMQYFGVARGHIENRKKRLSTYQLVTQKAYEKCIDQIIKADGWKKLKFSSIEIDKSAIADDEIRVTDVAARMDLNYRIQKHPNIITSFIAKSNGIKLSTRGQQYQFKFVKAEEKLSLGYSAYAIKGITEEDINLLEEKLKSKKDKGDILTIFAALKYYGADNKWIHLRALKLTEKQMVPLKDAIGIINDFVKSGILITKKFNMPHSNGLFYKEAYACAIVRDSAMKKELNKQVKSEEDLLKVLGINQKVMDENQEQNKHKKEIQDILAKEVLEAQPTTTEAKIYDIRTSFIEPIKEKKPVINQSSNTSEEIEKAVQEISELILKKCENHIQGIVDENEKNKKVIKEMEINYTNLLNDNDKLKTEIEDLKEYAEKLEKDKDTSNQKYDKIVSERNAYKEYSKRLHMHANDVSMQLTGNIMALTQQFISRPNKNNIDIGKYETQITMAIGAIISQIVNYSPESTVPPDER